MKSSPVATLLHQALRSLASNRSLRRRINDGRLDEMQLVASLWDAAQKAGIEAHMVEMVGSNHPLQDRDLPVKPEGYWLKSRDWLEVDGKLLGLTLDYPVSGEGRLKPHLYASRATAVKSLGGALDVQWATIDEQCQGEALEELVSDTLVRDLHAAALTQQTPNAPAKGARRRM